MSKQKVSKNGPELGTPAEAEVWAAEDVEREAAIAGITEVEVLDGASQPEVSPTYEVLNTLADRAAKAGDPVCSLPCPGCENEPRVLMVSRSGNHYFYGLGEECVAEQRDAKKAKRAALRIGEAAEKAS